MQLSALLSELPEIVDILARPEDLYVEVTGITPDSRRVTPGSLFVAYRGVSTDAHRYVGDAVARGAVAIVSEEPLPCLPVPRIQVADGRAALAWLSAAWYGHPSRAMALVGVTGTDGKTTTANLIFSILKAARRRVGLISTVHAVIGDQVYDTGLHTTTPDAPEVQRYLAMMRDAGTEVVVLEATSHGLAQHRVTGCAFDVAVVTNITHEHLDFHGTYEAYFDAKAMLFRSLMRSPYKPALLKTSVLNRDDPSWRLLWPIPAERIITYGLAGQGALPASPLSRPASGGSRARLIALTAVNIRYGPAATQFNVEVRYLDESPRSECHQLRTPLIGTFNVYNILAACSAALALGVDWRAIRAGVRSMTGIPGRMERVDRGQAFVALVDFAHTPNALVRALETARTLTAPDGRVIAIFGCAGLRDRLKRPRMGEIAAELADLTVLTAEDPRTESVEDIMAETAAALAASGRREGSDFVRIADRQQAILYGVRQARAGDVLIVCGKGHEQSMCFGAAEVPWQDRDALAWALDHEMGRAGPPPFILPTWPGL